MRQSRHLVAAGSDSRAGRRSAGQAWLRAASRIAGTAVLSLTALCGFAQTVAEHDAPASAARDQQAWHARYSDRYKRNWGVDIAGVRHVSSGYMLRLSYTVVDVARAAPLFDKRSRPYLIDNKTGARLAVPAMENIGELRQTATPIPGRTYFVIFGNPGKLVQPGDRVNIVIGDFKAEDVIVD